MHFVSALTVCKHCAPAGPFSLLLHSTNSICASFVTLTEVGRKTLNKINFSCSFSACSDSQRQISPPDGVLLTDYSLIASSSCSFSSSMFIAFKLMLLAMSEQLSVNMLFTCTIIEHNLLWYSDYKRPY